MFRTQKKKKLTFKCDLELGPTSTNVSNGTATMSRSPQVSPTIREFKPL